MPPLHRRVAPFAVAVAVAAVLAGCQGPSGTTNGTLSGHVNGFDTTLAGATVSADPGGHTTVSRADGSYSLVLPAGVYTVVASAPGYQPLERTLQSVTAGSNPVLDFDLLREAPPPVSASAGPDRFQVGFGAVVQLDGTASGPAGASLTFHWEQVPGAGPAVTLTGADTARPTFTTATLDELEAAGLYSIRRTAGNLAFSEADVNRATYQFEVTVNDGVTNQKARVTVRSVVGQPGLAVVPMDTLVPLSAGDQPSYAWTCQRDEGGTPVDCAEGVLVDLASRNPTFRADRPGLYTFATPGEPSFQLRAARYIGARPVQGQTTCFSCHLVEVVSTRPGRTTLSPKYDAWKATRHATYLERALLGELVSPITGQPVEYQGQCIRCHTTGYNPGADNGGFAQVAATAAASWTFPGVYSDMKPQLQALASVTCENCHGPGSVHRDGPTFGNIGKSFAAVDCAQCHATEPYENQGLQWANARHSRFITGFRPAADDPALQGICSSCHTSQGFVAWARSGVNTAPPVGADQSEPQTCAACHDPHGEARTPEGLPTPKQLRVYGDVTTVVPGVGARGVGPAALCMTCHNSRTSVEAAALGTPLVPASQVAPHRPTQADVLLAKNAATLGGGTYPSSVHTGVPKLCVGCHMAPTPPLGEVGHNVVGGHSFAVKNGDLVNMAACTSCHAGLGTFDRTAYGDYDGDGFLSGVQTEVDGLTALVAEQLSQQAVALWPGLVGDGAPALVAFNGFMRVHKGYVLGRSPLNCDPATPEAWDEACFAFPAGAIPQATPAEATYLHAAWNYLLVKHDRSRGVHNTAFSVSVLQRTYQALSGHPVPGAVLR